ncbi:MAG: thioredoxin family protein [Candidatus Micrarchaeota archaeon]
MSAIYLNILTSPNCPHSPKAIRVAERVIAKKHRFPIHFREISVITQEGEIMAESFHLDSTPTFTINGKVAFVGVPSTRTLNELLNDEINKEFHRDSYFF